MKPLTRKERDQVLRAAETFHQITGGALLALDEASGDMKLANRFLYFYGIYCSPKHDFFESSIQTRVLLLLLFREAGGVL